MSHEPSDPTGPTEPSSAALPKKGELLQGKWRLGDVLGEGGMGVVHSAVHETTGRRVAIKFLTPQLYGQQEALGRFLREAKVGGIADHPGIARVLDYTTTASGHPFLVMEYLEGTSLAELLDSDPPVGKADAIDYLISALETLAFIHARGILHRDLKPANIFCDPAGPPRTWILDFGVSCAPAEDLGLMELTEAGSTVGTPLYMSPEQARASEDVGPPADLWAIGVILYRVLTAAAPFTGESRADVVAALLTHDPKPPTKIDPTLPTLADRIIAKVLAKPTGKRYQSAGELAADLRRLSELMRNEPSPELTGMLGRLVAQGGRRRMIGPLAALVAAVVLGVLLFFGLREDEAVAPAGEPAQVASSPDAGPARPSGVAAGPDAGAAADVADDWVEPAGGPPLRMLWVSTGHRERQVRELEWVRRAFAGELGRPVELVVPESYDEGISLVLRDRVDFGGLPPAAYVLARKRDPKLRLLARLVAYGGASYQCLFLTLATSSVRKLADLDGRSLCLVDPASTSGYLYPRYMLRGAGVDPDSDLGSVLFTGNHPASLDALAAGRCEAAAVASNELLPWTEQRGTGLGGLRIVASSESIPGEALFARHDLPEAELAAVERVAARLVAATEAGEVPTQGDRNYAGFVAAKDSDYDGIRAVTR